MNKKEIKDLSRDFSVKFRVLGGIENIISLSKRIIYSNFSHADKYQKGYIHVCT